VRRPWPSYRCAAELEGAAAEREPDRQSVAMMKKYPRRRERANMPFSIHPHMLRHSCGYKFANEGRDTRSLQAYLGHRNIQSTVRYTAMAPDRFKGGSGLGQGPVLGVKRRFRSAAAMSANDP
jgi:hypothetical protein